MPEQWTVVDGQPTRSEALLEEVRTYDSLTLTLLVERSNVSAFTTPAVGQYDLVESVDGGFSVVDTSGTDNTITLQPPDDHSQLRSVDTWHIDSFNEKSRGARGQNVEVELELVPTKEKAFDNEYGTLGAESSGGENESDTE